MLGPTLNLLWLTQCELECLSVRLFYFYYRFRVTTQNFVPCRPHRMCDEFVWDCFCVMYAYEGKTNADGQQQAHRIFTIINSYMTATASQLNELDAFKMTCSRKWGAIKSKYGLFVLLFCFANNFHTFDMEFTTNG
jgi:hypothetical protein